MAKNSHKTCIHVVDSLVRTAKDKGAVGTSTRAVACAFASQPQPLLCAHPSELSLGHKNLLIDCGDDLFSNDLVLNYSALLFWRSSESLPSLSPMSNMMVSPFLPSSSSPRSPFRWTCDKSWDKRNTTPQRVPCLDCCHKKARLGRTAPTTTRRRWGRARQRRTPGSPSPS